MDKKQKLRMRSVDMNTNELFDVLSQLQAAAGLLTGSRPPSIWRCLPITQTFNNP